MNDDDVDHAAPPGFAFATSEELALALGAAPAEAKAFQTRIERIAGNNLTLVREGAEMTPEEGLPPLPQSMREAGLQQANVSYNPHPQLEACEYGASDMRAYGLECFRAGLEKAATVCEGQPLESWATQADKRWMKIWRIVCTRAIRAGRPIPLDEYVAILNEPQVAAAIGPE